MWCPDENVYMPDESDFGQADDFDPPYDFENSYDEEERVDQAIPLLVLEDNTDDLPF